MICDKCKEKNSDNMWITKKSSEDYELTCIKCGNEDGGHKLIIGWTNNEKIMWKEERGVPINIKNNILILEEY